MKEIKKYEFIAGYGNLGSKQVRGDKTTVRLVREKWYGRESYAIRAFLDDGTPLKGITLTADMLYELREILNNMVIE